MMFVISGDSKNKLKNKLINSFYNEKKCSEFIERI